MPRKTVWRHFWFPRGTSELKKPRTGCSHAGGAARRSCPWERRHVFGTAGPARQPRSAGDESSLRRRRMQPPGPRRSATIPARTARADPMAKIVGNLSPRTTTPIRSAPSPTSTRACTSTSSIRRSRSAASSGSAIAPTRGGGDDGHASTCPTDACSSPSSARRSSTTTPSTPAELRFEVLEPTRAVAHGLRGRRARAREPQALTRSAQGLRREPEATRSVSTSCTSAVGPLYGSHADENEAERDAEQAVRQGPLRAAHARDRATSTSATRRSRSTASACATIPGARATGRRSTATSGSR